MEPKEINTYFFKYFDNKYRLVHHALFWLIYFLDFFLTILDPNRSLSDPYGFSFTFLVLDAAMIYINLYWFIPKFLLKNRALLYVILTFISVALNILATTFIALWQCNCLDRISIYGVLGALVSATENITFFMGTAIGMKLFKIWIRNQRRIKDLQRDKLQTELDYLKSQINPHFLFNTLNNIYVQIKIDQKSASQTVLKLSDLLRYQLYDCSKDKVLLANEIDYLKNFLELERIRKSKLNIGFNVTGVINHKLIEPFVFIPFVENAVKHGSGGEHAFVNIDLEITDKEITFNIENSMSPSTGYASTSGGLGLSNIKRRLELMYPDRHKLMISFDEKTYKVKLVLCI